MGVQGATFEVELGEIFCIMGLSGSGKSTLVRHINRLIEPTAGQIEILGRDVQSLSERELRRVRARQIGMVFQHMALMPHRSVRDNVAYPLEIRKISKSKRWAISDHALGLVDLTGYEDRLPKELSGGMQQRVGIARVLYQRAELVLADEPVAAMDPLLADHTVALLNRLAAERLVTLVASLHAVDLALKHFPRVIGLRAGRLHFDCAVGQVSEAMLASLYANQELGAVPAGPGMPITGSTAHATGDRTGIAQRCL